MNSDAKLSWLGELSAPEAAKALIGCELERELDGEIVRVKIVETEAYDQTDAASHSYNGRTPRTDVMFGPAGYMYVYFTYGMHYCCNVVVGNEGEGAAVLIRAVEPVSGEATMQRYRHKTGTELTNGPAKLCQALVINKSMNGHDLTIAPLKLLKKSLPDTEKIVRTTRIGVSKAKEVQWRFYLANNQYVT